VASSTDCLACLGHRSLAGHEAYNLGETPGMWKNAPTKKIKTSNYINYHVGMVVAKHGWKDWGWFRIGLTTAKPLASPRVLTRG